MIYYKGILEELNKLLLELQNKCYFLFLGIFNGHVLAWIKSVDLETGCTSLNGIFQDACVFTNLSQQDW